MFHRLANKMKIFLGIFTMIGVYVGYGAFENPIFAFESGLFNEDIGSGGSYLLVSLLLIVAGLFLTTKSRERSKSAVDENDWREIISAAGYAYDEEQDIFYSRKDSWQRDMGYCRLYDEAAAPLNMIIDCEPIYFEYNNKRWLIELWKGQYGMTTGCEVGVYNTQGADIDIPGTFKGTFYNVVKNEEMLQISMTLKKGEKKLVSRKDKHWWLTAFILGEFSEPTELIMHMDITLKDSQMKDAFVNGLKIAGYSEEEITMKKGNHVVLEFNKPHSPQPLSRIKATDWMIQMKNKVLCDKYQEVTFGYKTFPEKVNAIQEKAPELYHVMMTFGKPVLLFKSSEVIKQKLGTTQ